MSFTSLPDITAGDFGRESWADQVKENFDDHETRIVAVEASGAGDVAGPSSSVASEVVLFDGTTGKLIKRATGTGYVKVTSGVMGTPAATVPIATDVGGLGTGVATALAVNVGSAGAPVVNGGALGTPSSGTATNLTGLPLSTGVTGNLPLSNLPTNFAQIFKATVTLTDAQIKALPTTGITLVAAQGAGLRVTPLLVTIRSNFTAGAYTNVNATYASLAIGYGTGGSAIWVITPISNDNSLTTPLDRLTTFLGANARVVNLPPYIEDVENAASGTWGYPQPQVIVAPGSAENVALTISIDNNGSGNLTDGNAANAAIVTVVYLVL